VSEHTGAFEVVLTPLGTAAILGVPSRPASGGLRAHLTRHVRRFGATTPALLRRDGPPVTTVQDAVAGGA
jgi:hypothetical protein